MKWVLIVIALGGGFLYLKKGGRSSIAQAKTPEFRALMQSQSCAGKKACVLLYVTPWCPACLSMSPLFQQMKQKMEGDPDYGMKVIVGQERSPGGNKQMAARYGVDSLIDGDNKILNVLEIDRYPTILLVESNGHILKKHQDVIQWAAPRYQLRP